VSKALPKLAVFKFASCDGCQLSLLDCEDELLLLTEQVEIAYFLEASRTTVEGPYDLTLVEGSITTPADRDRIDQIRRASKKLVTIGACATSGGIQALRNFANTADFVRAVYARPEYVSTLENSTPIAAHVSVDFELQGCPIDKRQLLDVILSLLRDRRPAVRNQSVCVECNQRGTVCVMVPRGEPSQGPVTHAACGARCPSYARGCFGSYGPSEVSSVRKLLPALQKLASPKQIERLFSTFNVSAPGFIDGHGLLAASDLVRRPETTDVSARRGDDVDDGSPDR
jgi:coenzyme F420-reducing hydrogenase gamma subunit